MNLLDPAASWLTLRGHDEHLSPGSVLDIVNPDVADLHAPRADFRAAQYQLLIGLLQMALLPEDHDDWLVRWHNPPSRTELEATLHGWQSAFQLDGEAPLFMQDQDPLLDGAEKPITDLLIDLGSDSNLFFKPSTDWQGLCPACTATALFTLQINAPSGGVGHRTGLRGGGPLTTLLMPDDPDSTLWQKLWLNVLPAEALKLDSLPQPHATLLPWLGRTRTSDKTGVETLPDDMAPLHPYWSMPRRIRLSTPSQGRHCALCQQAHAALYSHYRTRNYGINYTGPWQHPLTPYQHDPKDQKPPLSLKGSYAARGYRHWLALCHGREKQPQVANVVRDYRDHKRPALRQGRRPPRLWCFGYEMDNMKALAWHDSSLPLFNLQLEDPTWFTNQVQQVLDAAQMGASILGDQVRKARNQPGKEPAVEQSYWHASETSFYALVQQLATFDDASYLSVAEPLRQALRQWLHQTRKLLLDLFDQWVLAAPSENMDLKEIIEAQQAVRSATWHTKPFKALWELARTAEEVDA
ncbi:type I-E CRISPR-associated protein Cse1/CasA [Leeia sp.]|uniref:type I-E CRISPR-associated protein Cse1/CasA n=1 Tax=Leeia sp. TaxID=2884678 RepID=UPI0035AEC84D